MLDFSFHNFGCEVYSHSKQYFEMPLSAAILYTRPKRISITVMGQENTQAEEKDCQVACVSNFDRCYLTFVCVWFALQLSQMLSRLALIHVVLFTIADMSCGYHSIEND